MTKDCCFRRGPRVRNSLLQYKYEMLTFSPTFACPRMLSHGSHGLSCRHDQSSSLQMHQLRRSLLAISASFVGIDIPCSGAVTPPVLLSDPQLFNECSS